MWSVHDLEQAHCICVMEGSDDHGAFLFLEAVRSCHLGHSFHHPWGLHSAGQHLPPVTTCGARSHPEPKGLPRHASGWE